MSVNTIGELLVIEQNLVYLVTKVNGESCGLWWFSKRSQHNHLYRLKYSSCFSVDPEEWTE